MLFDKNEVKKSLSLDNIYQLILELGGEPIYTSFGLISATICHNPRSEGSHKLYYYSNSALFHCYTGCADPSFDIFELVIKVFKIQKNLDYDLDQSVKYVANYFGISGTTEPIDEQLTDDWEYLNAYDELRELDVGTTEFSSKIYDKQILNHFNYNFIIKPWIDDGISQEVMQKAKIGYYTSNDQITIPHFNPKGELIGVRGRTMVALDAEMFGKYRPLKINGLYYNHPLGTNLYGLNWNKDNIRKIGKAIILESEKSCLQYATKFGWENNIAVACCGSNITSYQIKLLLAAGAKEIIIALDRQFQQIGDNEFVKLTTNLTKIHERFHNYAIISFIFDKNMITKYKESPTDTSKENFIKLFKERIFL